MKVWLSLGMVLGEMLLIAETEFNLMAFTVINAMACTSIDLLTVLSKVTNYEIKCSFKMQFKFSQCFLELMDLS